MSADYKKFLFVKNLAFNFPEIDEKQIPFRESESPLELKYHIRIVLLALKEAFEKFKVSLILPRILENPKVLQQYLQNTQYNQCLELVKGYRRSSKCQSRPELHQPAANDILKIIDYCQENHQILNVLPNWIDDLDVTEKYYLKVFENVYKIAEERLQRSAVTDLAKEKRLHVFYLANEETKANIKKIKHKIQQKKINLLWKHGAKSGVIQKLEEDLAFRQYDSRLFVKWEMSKTHREIQRTNNTFSAKQQELEENVKKARLNYEAKLKMDLSQEKSIQDERNKVQLQLLALIKKYDQTMYDKHVEEMLLQEECNKQKQELEEVLKVYKKEEEIYEEVVVKQQRLQEAKALMFAYTRAATKIQKWWKAIHRRMAKEKAKQRRKDKAAKKKKSVQ